MSEQTVAKPGCVIPRLQLAYLLQFAIWGSWSIALGGYMLGKMTGKEVGYLFMAVPVGAIVAPMFIGPIADRFFSAQKMLGVLHLISGAALVACGVISAHAEAAAQGGQVTVSFWPIMILMLISGLCYMPSIPLINAVVFKHVPESSKQPGIFIFGTVGWILVCLLIEVFAGGAAKPNFFFIGGGCGLALGLYAFTLPNTPPKGAPAPGEKRDALGLGALKMFGDPKFTIFVLCAFAVSIFGSNFYFPALVSYLSENGFPAPVALGTLNQFSELFFMALLAVLVSRIGLKWVLVLGMSAWAARYIIFSQEGFQFALVGLLLHGMAYAYLYTAAYMFGDKVAPDNLKASVQSLLAFLLLGIGQLLSGLFFGTQIDDCQAQMTKIDGIQIESQQTQVDVDQLYRVPMDKISWSTKDAAESPMRFFNLIKSLKYLEGDKNVFDLAEYDLANFQNDDGTLNLDAIGAVGNDAVFGETETARIGKDELKAGFVEVAQKCEKDVSRLTREDWLNVQKHDKLSFLGNPVFRVPMANVSWSAKDAAENPLRFLDLAKSVKYLQGHKDVFDLAANDLVNFQNDGGTLNLDAIGAVDSEMVFGKTETAKVGKDELKTDLDEVAKACGKNDASQLTREDWLSVQKHDWKKFFSGKPFFPAYFCLFWVVLFILFGREPQAADAKKDDADIVS